MAECEICFSTEFDLISKKIREGVGRICRCKNCGLTYQEITLSPEELDEYYNKAYQETNSLVQGQILTARQHYEDRKKTIDQILRKITPLLRSDMKVLELGCGAGELLDAIKGKVAEVVGIELNKEFIDFIKNNLGFEGHDQDINLIDFGGRQFDLIISIATLDHLRNPKETLQTLKGLLAPDGLMYFEVPNLDDCMNLYLPEPNKEKYNIFFWHLAHYFYFSKYSLARIMDTVGFDTDIKCRHEYTFKNFMNWFFTGTPQKSFLDATRGFMFFNGSSGFEQRMNGLMNNMESEFHQILAETFTGDSLCCIARHKRKK